MHTLSPSPTRRGIKQLGRAGLVGLTLVSATACNTMYGKSDATEGIGRVSVEAWGPEQARVGRSRRRGARRRTGAR